MDRITAHSGSPPIRPTLAPYVGSQPPSASAFNNLIQQMDEVIRGSFTEGEVKQYNIPTGGHSKHFIVPLVAIEAAMGVSVESLSSYRNGKQPIPRETWLALHELYRRVMADPSIGREAYLDYRDRYKEDTS